jgi:threonine dehydrogenase-like Zn-dependent dehydrogenase
MPMTIAGNTVHGIGYSNDVAGSFAQYMPLAECLLLEVPNGLPAAHAVEKARPTPDDVPLVIGCGPVGLAVVAS